MRGLRYAVRMAGTPKTDEDRQAYLDALCETGVQTYALRKAGLSYSSLQGWRKDPEFVEAEQLAKEEAADLLEVEAFRRAHHGVTRTKYNGTGKDAVEYEEQAYSDTLLIFLLKGAKPDKFKERVASEISGAGGKPIEMNDTTAAARLAAILESAKHRAADDELFG